MNRSPDISMIKTEHYKSKTSANVAQDQKKIIQTIITDKASVLCNNKNSPFQNKKASHDFDSSDNDNFDNNSFKTDYGNAKKTEK